MCVADVFNKKAWAFILLLFPEGELKGDKWIKTILIMFF